MNYLKWALIAVIFALFFFPLMEMQSLGGSIFADSFFTSTGFLVVALAAMANLFFVNYSLEVGKKKDAEEAAAK